MRIKQLKAQGLTVVVIAERMGLRKGYIHALLKKDREESNHV